MISKRGDIADFTFISFPGWWFGAFGLFFHILGTITPTD
jgi:hypothetical protein